MLQLHFSNRHESLASQLLERLAGSAGDPFAGDELIVPSAALRRELTLAIARAHGVCANVRFDFLARWLWRQIGRVLPAVAAESPFEPALLQWRLHAAFGDAGFVGAHPRLARYLAGADPLMRFELAGRVAALLEQYVTYRPDWLEAWQQGRGVDLGTAGDAARADLRWQAELWRRLAGELGLDAPHPSAAFVDALRHGGAALVRSSGLPAHAHVFALPAMPPLHVELLEQLGRWIDIDLYVLNPCREYWFEVIDRRRLGHLAARGRAAGHEEGNRLLAAWGRQTQAHVDLLVDRCADAVDDSRFVANDAPSLLAALQNAILDLVELAPGSLALTPDDRSIEVHACHSLTRQLEVLHDRLLGLFAADAALRPDDVLVVLPDLEAAAPLIDAVFGTVPAERHVPYAMTGRARSRVSAPARALLALLALADSRVPASALFGLLQQSIVARRFALDDDALERVHGWMRDAGIRWALDARHRADAGVPADERHTLADGLARLFLGYALPADAGAPFAGLLPAGDAEGNEAVALGALWRYTEALARLHDDVRAPRLPAAWAELLHDATDRFLAPADDELEDLRELHAAIADLAESMQQGGVAEPLPLTVVQAALAERLDHPARGGVPTGSVTFASMASLRGLPFAVVCAIGLDDGAFPSGGRPAEFDLMAAAPRRGDRQRRDDERNVFLDLLLAARRHLHLAYTGRSVRDNAPLPPSVLVAELLDVLVPAIAADPASADALHAARRRLVVEHPLQSFALEAFAIEGDPRLRSHDGELADALRRGLDAAPAPADVDTGPDDPDEAEDRDLEPLPAFFTQPLAPPGTEWHEVAVEQLVEFFRNPCRYLLKRRLGVELQGEVDELEDDEPFLADWPGRTALARRLLPLLLDGRIDLA
ncbi:MAG TPA: exodeoxyribonuclease V subunit gamma, partial [Ideonella sp.]|nr:exodeoxyribonuclease V subunit gamma [Ideonella sp.]